MCGTQINSQGAGWFSCKKKKESSVFKGKNLKPLKHLVRILLKYFSFTILILEFYQFAISFPFIHFLISECGSFYTKDLF